MLNEKEKNVLKILFDSQDYITSQNISEITGYSERSVRTYIKSLNDFLSTYSVNIVTKRGVGYLLTAKDKSVVKKFIHTNNQNDRIYKILHMIFLERCYGSKFNFLDKLCISEYTLKADIEKIKKLLSDYDIKLKSDFKVVGSEESIRSFIVSYFFKDDNFDLISNEFNIESPKGKDIIDIIVKKCREYNIQISDFVVRNLALHILLAIQRIKASFVIKDINCERFDKNIVNAANDIIRELSLILKFDIPQSEINYICLHLSNKTKINTSEIEIDDKELFDSIIELEKHFFKNFSGSDYRDSVLEKDLYNHIFYLINRLSEGVNLKNPLLSDIKSKYGAVFEQVRDSINTNKYFSALNIDEHELAYITIHILAALEKLRLSYKAKALVVCSTGYGSSKLLCNRLLKYFDNALDIETVIGAYDIDDSILSKVDLIISTVPIEHINTNIPTLVVSVFLHDTERAKISSVIGEIVKSRSLENDCRPFIDTILDSSLFFIENSNITKDEIINKLANSFLENRYIENVDAFISEVKLRESFSSTAFSELIAMPHPQAYTFDKGLKKSGLGVAIIKNGVVWDEYFDNIKLVFLYLPSHEENDGLRIVTNFIIDLIDDDEKVSKLLNCNTFSEFRSIFKKMLLEDEWKRKN